MGGLNTLLRQFYYSMPQKHFPFAGFLTQLIQGYGKDETCEECETILTYCQPYNLPPRHRYT